MRNDENVKPCHFLPLRNRGSFFGLKTGSRGTPWNSKNAGPGGSDFTKCQFWSFKWHFGHFGRGVIFWPFFTLFHFLIFVNFDDFDFLHFVTFSVFLILMIFSFSAFLDFWWFLIIFYALTCFWSLFVVKLGAPMMTHFLSSKPALPLSPILVVKLWPIFTPDFVITFWSFLSDFCVHLIENDEKLDFAIKKHHFWHFFDIKFEWFLSLFCHFFGSFLGFLGGYPSPSISAPLVVKKCPKLYIYI